jgi:prepilin signal peptidase PulO-like enzyme (type II secretory pathway)
MLEYRVAVNSGLKKKIKNKKIDKNFSFCDNCGRRLKWCENVPIISWCLQGGKTKCCQKKLPLAYPLVELTTGILFVVNLNFYFLKYLSSFELINFKNLILMFIACVIIVALVFSFIFDLKYMYIFDAAIILMSAAAIALNYGEKNLDLNNFISAFVASGFLLFLYFITKKQGMGLGDVELAFFMGVFLNWEKTIVAFYVAFIVGAIFGLILMLLKKVKFSSKVPFGPFLILGTVFAWWFGDTVINFVYRVL